MRWPWQSSDERTTQLLLRRVEATYSAVLAGTTTVRRDLRTMSAQTDADYQKLQADIATVADGWAAMVNVNNALTSERDALKAALEQADADKAAAVAAQHEADDAELHDKISAADAAISAIQAAPPVEPPADNGTGGEDQPGTGSDNGDTTPPVDETGDNGTNPEPAA